MNRFPEIAPASLSDAQGAAPTVHVVQLTLGDGSEEGGGDGSEEGGGGGGGGGEPVRVPVVAASLDAAGSSAPGRPAPKPFSTSGNRTRPNNQTRHQRFAQFLVDTFGIERLRSGAGVLDVAGGAGGVAFELAFRRGIPCTTVHRGQFLLTRSSHSGDSH